MGYGNADKGQNILNYQNYCHYFFEKVNVCIYLENCVYASLQKLNKCSLIRIRSVVMNLWEILNKNPSKSSLKQNFFIDLHSSLQSTLQNDFNVPHTIQSTVTAAAAYVTSTWGIRKSRRGQYRGYRVGAVLLECLF